jgi:hypothetical protein
VRRQQKLLDFIKFTLTLSPTQGLTHKRRKKSFVNDDAIIKFIKKIFSPRSRSLDESNRFFESRKKYYACDDLKNMKFLRILNFHLNDLF